MGKINLYNRARKFAKLILLEKENLDRPHFMALMGFHLNVVDYKTLNILLNYLESYDTIMVFDGVVKMTDSFKKEVSQ